jgi:uncharacterized protein
MKRVIAAVCCLMLAGITADASEFRFSPSPNKANLIQWRGWGREAFDEAKKKDRLVLLSLSAVWCHWCHVMDETTYSDEDLIKFINEHFIPVRVDADMRPDIDALYNQGGWPSTVILTAEGDVLTGGNYIPPDVMKDRLAKIAESTGKDKEALAERIAKSRERQRPREKPGAAIPDEVAIRLITERIKGSFDERHGGFGTGQKFPSPPTLDFLIAQYAKNNDLELKKIITTTLDSMARGGLHDRVEGGFFRYATKPDWSEPHYEKMLEVNAGMIRNYADAGMVFGNKEYGRIASETATYVRKNLYDPESGAFFGSQDADEEYYKPGQRTGQKPPADRTVYTDSSSLMISALLAAHASTGSGECLVMAKRGADFLMRELSAENGGLFHYYREGKRHLQGQLIDHALFGAALLDLYQASGDGSYLALASRIEQEIISRFYVEDDRIFRTSPEPAVVSPATVGMLKEIHSLASNYRALLFLSRLQHVNKDKKLKARIDAVIATLARRYEQAPVLAALYGSVLVWNREDPLEITLLSEGLKSGALLSAVDRVFVPEKVVRVFLLGRDAGELKSLGYSLQEAVYLCVGKRCSKPITDPEDLAREIKQFMKGPIDK